jgi:CHRD domain
LLKRLPLALAAIALVLLPGATSAGASAPATHFVAHLSGAQEVPPTSSTGTGKLDLRLVAGGTKLTFKLTSNGVSQIIQSHIHIGAKGTNGAVKVFFFAPPPAPWNSVTGDNFEVSGVRTAVDVHGVTFADLVTALRSGNAYVNIHSPDHPGGEIRGQIMPVGDNEED